MKKKILFAVIAACLCLFAFGLINASAATYGDLTYSVSDGEVTIVDCSPSATIVDIPSEIYGYPVTSIGDSAFSDCKELTNISIPDSVTEIGEYAFKSCSNLKYIKVPQFVNKIESFTFAGCEKLEAIQISENITKIGILAFVNCRNLTIYCYENTVTHEYAVKESISYKLMDADSFVPEIILNKSITILNISDTEKLFAATIPNFAANNDITWSSSNENTATVKDGVVSAVGMGSSTITAATTDNTAFATCLVVVADVSHASLDVKAQNGEIGETITVTISSPAIANVIGGECRLHYDSTKMEYIGTKSNLSECFTVMSSGDEGFVTFLFAPSIDYAQEK